VLELRKESLPGCPRPEVTSGKTKMSTTIETITVTRPMKVIAFTCCTLTVFLMIGSVSCSDWVNSEGWREGLFVQCIDKGAPTPIPFGTAPTPGCHRAHSAGYVRGTAALIIICVLTDFFGTLLTGLGLRSTDPNKKYKYYRVAIYSLLVATIALFLALIIYPVSFSKEIDTDVGKTYDGGRADFKNFGSLDFDGDGVLDHLDKDDDNDGIPDDQDTDDDNDGIPDDKDTDDDNDGILDKDDGDNDDFDGDGTPDALDNDDDNDGTPDHLDTDDDNDGIPDAIDTDDDNDGIPDNLDDTETDSDNDGIPDVHDTDDDNDGTPDALDNDDDGDGTPDAVEEFDADGDADNDGTPDALDNDDDNDGIPDNQEQLDSDNDGIPDALDDDDDGDGTPDALDNDDDNDGIPDDQDYTGDARVWQFGFGYGAGWFSAVLMFASLTLLICDRESEEIFYKERPVEEDEEAGGED